MREVAREIIDRYGQPALVEEYILGREFTVGLLGERRPRVLPPMEVVFLNAGGAPRLRLRVQAGLGDARRATRSPRTLTKDELRAIERTSRTTFTALGCRDVARVDLRIDARRQGLRHRGEPAPGPHARLQRSLPHRERRRSIDYRTLIGDILSGAIKRWREKQGDPQPTEPTKPALNEPDLTN